MNCLQISITKMSKNLIVNSCQSTCFKWTVVYRFSKLSVRSSNALKTYIKSDIGIQGGKIHSLEYAWWNNKYSKCEYKYNL